jgi:hypothetical protein
MNKRYPKWFAKRKVSGRKQTWGSIRIQKENMEFMVNTNCKFTEVLK